MTIKPTTGQFLLSVSRSIILDLIALKVGHWIGSTQQ